MRYNAYMDTNILSQAQALRRMIDDSARIVFLGGAGTSTESGVPDFRSSNGVFKAVEEFGRPPEELLSHDFFCKQPETFYRYYRKYLLYPNAQPNDAHRALAALERAGKLTAVVTQNIDNLHQAAGSKNVLELHGSVYRNHCLSCDRAYTLDELLAMDVVPRCACGGLIKPDVVLYGEGLDGDVLGSAVEHIAQADMLLIGGTSLVVYPAAGLADYFSGKNLAVINMSRTHQDSRAKLVISAPIGQVLRAALGDDYGAF